jgi:tetratricopeptide (TPR) repeat protein
MIGLVCCLGLAGLAVAQVRVAAPTPEAGTSRPPWQRLLQGTEAKKAAELEARIEQLQEAGKWEEALRAAQEITELRARVQGEEHWEAVNARWLVKALQAVQRQNKEVQKQYAGLLALDRDAERLEARGYREAQPLRQKALDIRREVLGEDHPDTALSYNNLAYNLTGQSRNKEAEEGFNKALAIYRKLLGERHPDTARGYYNLAHTLVAQSRYPEAVEGYQKALAIRLEVLGEEHADTASSYNTVAYTMAALGRYKEADSSYRKALEIYRKVLGEEHPYTALSHSNVAFNLAAQGRYREAEEGYQKALAIRRKVLGEEHPVTAASYNNLAVNLYDEGRYKEAEEVHRKALDIRRKVLGEEHADTGSSYNNIALNLKAQGRYQDAEAAFKKALDISRKVHGEEHTHTAACYNNVAFSLSPQGRYQEAAEGFQKALAICRKVLGEDDPHTANSYSNIAHNLYAQGRYQEAEEGYQKALAIRRKVLGEEHPETAASYTNFATNLAAQGRYKEAEEGFQKALDIFRKVLGEEHPNTARVYHTIATNLAAQGRYREAEQADSHAAAAFLQSRLQIAASGLGRAARTSEHSPLIQLAALLAHNGKPAAAWQRLEQGLGRAAWDDLSARLRRPATDLARQTELVRQLERLDQLLAQHLAIREPTPAQKEQRDALLDRRLKTQEQLTHFAHDLEEKYGPVEGKVFDRETIQAALPANAALIAWIDVPATPKAADPNGEHWAILLRSQGQPIFERLSGSGPGGAWTEDDAALPRRLRSALQKPRGDWSEPAKQLSERRLKPLSRHLAAGKELPAVRHLIALPSEALAGVPLEAWAEDYLVSYATSATLYAHLRNRPAGKGAGLLAVGDPIFETVKKKERPLPPRGVLLTLVQPGSRAAEAGLRPDDVLLQYGNVELNGPADFKPEPESDDARQRVVLSVWRNGKVEERRIRPGKLGVLMAGKPAPEALAERYRTDRLLATRSGDEDWPQLPGTRVEVESLRHLFGDRPGPKLLFDSEASEQNLDEQAQSGELGKYRYLHLATHGEVDDTVALRSAVILSRDALPNPQTQLLAGKPVYDGRLTAEEMLRSWHLDCELVTLSACQTALGKYERGEGFMGFAQALLICGSRSVCLSLWKVDDAATALLMQRFYANLLGKRDGLKAPLPKAAALREAKEWLRNLSRAEALRVAAEVSQGVERGKGRPRQPLLPPVPERSPAAADDKPYAHPYYWAAFVLIGDPS